MIHSSLDFYYTLSHLLIMLLVCASFIPMFCWVYFPIIRQARSSNDIFSARRYTMLLLIMCLGAVAVPISLLVQLLWRFRQFA